MIHEAGIAGTFYSYDTPVLPQPEDIMDHADQANLNGPYGPQVNGFGLGTFADGDECVAIAEGTNSDKAHLIVTYTAQKMSVTANYVLVDKNGKPVTDENGNKVFLANNAVSLGNIGSAVDLGTFKQVQSNGSTSTENLSVDKAVPTIPGYVLTNKDGVWESDPLRYSDLDLADESGKLIPIVPELNADGSYKLSADGKSLLVKTGDGKYDIVAQTAAQYKDYVENVYNQYVADYNKLVADYTAKHATEIAADPSKELTEKTAWFAGLNVEEQINEIWGQSNLDAVDAKNAKHPYQPAQNYVTYQYQLDPTITYTYKSGNVTLSVDTKDKTLDTTGKKLLMKNAAGAFVAYDGTTSTTLYYDTPDHKVALEHVDPTYADVDATTGASKGAGAYTVTDNLANVAGYSRSDKQGAIFDGNASVTNNELPNTNFNVTFTAQTQQVNVAYDLAEADKNNAAAVAKVADMHGHTLAVAIDTTYKVDADGTKDAFGDAVDAIPAGHVVGAITVNGVKVAFYDNETHQLMTADGKSEFTTMDQLAVANDGATVKNNVGYTTDTLKDWTAPATLTDNAGQAVTNVVNDTTYVTDQTYPVNVPAIKGYTATIQQLSTDGKKVLNSWSATQFATLQKAGLVMVDGGATYKVTYTPIAETVQVTYTKPGVSGAYLTADTVSTVVDATFDVTEQGPLASQIPVGYQVASVSINGGEEIAIDKAADSDFKVAYRVDANGNVIANTVVYKLKPSLQHLKVAYAFASNGGTNKLPATVDDLKYSTGENFNLTKAGYVPAIPGYTASVKDSAGNTIDFANDVQMSSTGLTLNVTYTPKKQTVAVNYDTTNLSDTQKDAVNTAYNTTVLVNGSITGKTDDKYADVTSGVPSFDYTTVKAVPGYTFTIVDAAGKAVVTNSKTDFKFTSLPDTLAVNADGKLNNGAYTVTYTPVQQKLQVNFTYDTSKGETPRAVSADKLATYNVTEQDATTETGDNTADNIVTQIKKLLKETNNMPGYAYTIKVTSGTDVANYQDVSELTDADLKVSGYTYTIQIVDKVYATFSDPPVYKTIAEAAAAMALYDHDDDFDQQIIVTYTKSTNQKACLTGLVDDNGQKKADILGDSGHGVTGEQIKFAGITDADLHRKGYTAVLVQKVGDVETPYANMNSLPTYTADDDEQIFTVEYTPKAQNVPVVTEGLPNNLMPSVPGSSGVTDGDYVLPDAEQLAALTVAGYHITGYKLVGANGDETIKSFDATGFAGQKLALNTNPKSDSDLKYTQFVVTYAPDMQQAKVIVMAKDNSAAAKTYESEEGVTGGDIKFTNVTDSDLQIPGYSYVVKTSVDKDSQYQTLADAEQAMSKFDNTVNGTATTDSNEQTYTVTYTPLDQSTSLRKVCQLQRLGQLRR